LLVANPFVVWRCPWRRTSSFTVPKPPAFSVCNIWRLAYYSRTVCHFTEGNSTWSSRVTERHTTSPLLPRNFPLQFSCLYLIHPRVCIHQQFKYGLTVNTHFSLLKFTFISWIYHNMFRP
jgi:hypothetical protein